MKNSIVLEQLSYEYRPGLFKKPVHAVKDVSLEIKSGETFGFLGHNGAGKTTVIKCLVGLQRPTKGRALLGGVDSFHSEARRGLGFLPEQPYFYDHLSVEELLHFYGTLCGLSRARLKKRIQAVLEELHLMDRKNVKLRSLSKGLMQRVGLAQALIATPTILVLDEPFSGLDPIGRKEFRDIFTRLRSEGTTIFMSSHVLSDVEAICDRVSILVKGVLKKVITLSEQSFMVSRIEIVADVGSFSNKGEVLSSGKSRFLVDTLNDANSLISHLQRAGGNVYSVTPEHQRLEDLFISVVSETSKA